MLDIHSGDIKFCVVDMELKTMEMSPTDTRPVLLINGVHSVRSQNPESISASMEWEWVKRGGVMVNSSEVDMMKEQFAKLLLGEDMPEGRK
ncbi:Rop guanine nucleotide exchange factor 3-like protein [Tanacetum coccineum]